MKVAFLLRGAISKPFGKLSTKYTVKNMNTYSYVNYYATKTSIQKHIIEANPDCTFDFFSHCWHTNIEDNIKNLYNPVQSIFEDNEDYKDIILKRLGESGGSAPNYGQVSSALSMKKVTELLRDYHETYDMVIYYRYDVLLWKDIILKEYTPDKIWINADERRRYKGDFHFIMNYENALDFGLNLYDTFNEKTLKPIDHKYIYPYVIHILKKSLDQDNIIAGKHQEVTRKLKKVSLTDSDLSIYNITREEVNSYKP